MSSNRIYIGGKLKYLNSSMFLQLSDSLHYTEQNSAHFMLITDRCPIIDDASKNNGLVTLTYTVNTTSHTD